MSTELFTTARLVYHPRSWLTAWPRSPLFYTDRLQCARVEKIPLRDAVATSYIGGDESIYKEPQAPATGAADGPQEPPVTCRGTKKKKHK